MTILFSAADQANGTEPWISDGTPEGTSRLADISPGIQSSGPSEFTSIGGKELFFADDGVHGREPWVTDGTAAGTLMITDTNPGTADGQYGPFVTLTNRTAVFLSAAGAYPDTSNHLWVTDGTAAGTQDVKQFLWAHIVGELADGKVLLEAQDAPLHNQLWITDGTSAGTKSIASVSGVMAMHTLPSNKSAAVFVANGGSQLWLTDGTASGTALLKDIDPGFAPSGALNPVKFAAAGNGALIFFADDGVHGSEPWVTDGTALGTHLLADITPGASGSLVGSLQGGESIVELGNGIALFDTRNAAGGVDLWKTDGTAPGTQFFSHLNLELQHGTGKAASFTFSPEINLTALGNGKAVLSAYDPDHGTELWITDGSADGTHLVKDISPGASSSLPEGFAPSGDGRLFFSADDGVHGHELWVTDGTAVGTSLVSDILPGADSSNPAGFAPLDRFRDLGSHGTSWPISGIGDFKGDGDSDILWRSPSTGQVDEWSMHNGYWSKSIDLGATKPANWQLAGVGDFDGDGTSDVIWRDITNSKVDQWHMKDSNWSKSIDLGSTKGAEWSLAGVGDFNGDGTTDVLWRNVNTSQVDQWQMKNGNWSKSIDLGATKGAEWSLAGVGDFNGDGTTDVLWRNVTTSQVDEWQMKNGNWSKSIDLGATKGADWIVAGIGDFNHDGTSDILWFSKSTGQEEYWAMARGTWGASVNLGTLDKSWQPAGIGDFNHDGAADALWLDPATGHVQEQLWL